MEVIHHIGANLRDDRILTPKRLEEWGMDFQLSPLPGKRNNVLITFDISETHPSWKAVSKIVARRRLLDIYDTYFDDKEIADAEWVRLVPVFSQGYPQPKSTWVTDPPNYDDFCRACGTHSQTSPFRIAKEPYLGRKHFMSLHWGWQVFARMEVFETMAERGISGYAAVDVILHKTDQPSEFVKQIMPSDVAQNVLARRNQLKAVKCKRCGLVKYYYHRRGVMYLNRDVLPPDVDFFCSGEWFGAGGKSAYREILASSRFARLVLEADWKGLRMKPAEIE